MTPTTKRTIRWTTAIVLGLALGWAGSRVWSQQRQLRAGLRLVASKLTTAPQNTTGLATPTSVAVRGTVFDLAAMIGSGDLAAEIDRLAATVETLSKDETLDCVARLMEAALNLRPNQLRKLFTAFNARAGLNAKMQRLGNAIESKLGGPEFENRMQRVMRQLIVVDPERALLFAEAMPQAERGGFSSQMYDALALQQPERVVEMMLDPAAAQTAGLSDSQRADALTAAFKTLAARSSADATARWSQLPDGPLKSAALRGLLEPWVDQDPRGAWVWSQQLTGEAHTEAVRAVLPHLETPELTAWLTQNEATAANAGRQSDLAYLAVTKLAGKDPAAAIAWFSRMPWAQETLQQDGFYRDFARTAASDPTRSAQAAADVRALSAGAQRDKLLGYMTRSWAEVDAPAAREWIATLSPQDRLLLQPRFSSDRYAELARQVGLDDFAAAPRAQLPNARVNEIFSQPDGDQAVAMIDADLASGVSLDAYRHFIPSIAAKLARTSESRAVAWAEGQPEPGLRDSSLASIATQAGLTPDAAAGIVGRIADPIIRQRAERAIAARRIGLTVSD